MLQGRQEVEVKIRGLISLRLFEIMELGKITKGLEQRRVKEASEVEESRQSKRALGDQ